MFIFSLKHASDCSRVCAHFIESIYENRMGNLVVMTINVYTETQHQQQHSFNFLDVIVVSIKASQLASLLWNTNPK